MINEVHIEFLCRDPIFKSVKKWIQDKPDARLMFLVDSCPHCNRMLLPCDLLERYGELTFSIHATGGSKTSPTTSNTTCS